MKSSKSKRVDDFGVIRRSITSENSIIDCVSISTRYCRMYCLQPCGSCMATLGNQHVLFTPGSHDLLFDESSKMDQNGRETTSSQGQHQKPWAPRHDGRCCERHELQQPEADLGPSAEPGVSHIPHIKRRCF